MNVAGIAILSCLLPLVVLAPARWAVLSLMAGVLFITQGQQFYLGGINVFAVRVLEIAAVARVVSRGELKLSAVSQIDRALIVFYIYTPLVFLARSSDGQAFAIGLAIDALFCYFTFRALILTVDDFRWVLRAFVFLLIPYVSLVLYENVTTNNPFASMGGFGLSEFDVGTWSRGGRLRSYGSFRHPSLLGTLGASFLPLYIGLCFDKRGRAISAIGIILCLAIVWASNSGGPAGCVAVALIGWLAWTLRTKMHLVRRGIVAILVLAALFMKAPVWYLLARFSDLTGGDGWHRSYLLDVSFQNLGDWWLAGMPTRDTAHWFPYTNVATGGADLTNQYIAFGISSGLGAVALLVALLVRSYQRLGAALAVLRAGPEEGSLEFLYWGMAVMLTVHVFNWFGVSYFDQIYVVWFMHLAVIATLSEAAIRAAPATVSVRFDSNRLVSMTRAMRWTRAPAMKRFRYSSNQEEAGLRPRPKGFRAPGKTGPVNRPYGDNNA